MRESTIETYLKDELLEIGIIAYKFVSPGRRGVPDRICVGAFPVIFFVETKAPGETLEPWQVREIKKLKDKGYEVWIIDSKEGVDDLVSWYA